MARSHYGNGTTTGRATLSRLDRAIGYISPSWQAKRIRSRVVGELLRRRYEAGGSGRRLTGWNSPATSANAEVELSLANLRSRSRDLTRNNGWAARAITARDDNIVGTGILGTPLLRAGDQRDQVLEVWRAWAESTDCDADGRLDLYGLQGLVTRSVDEAGEVLIRRRIRRTDDGLRIPLQLQVLEADHLDSTRDRVLPNGGRIFQGIEFDPIGRRVAYWLFPEHPGDSGLIGATYQPSRRVPASEIQHVYEVYRPGQARGIPKGAPIFLTLRDLDDYADAQLLRQKIAACYVGFVHDVDAGENIPAVGSDDEVVQFEPGTWEHLPPGKDIRFGTPPLAEGFVDYAGFELRQVAIGYEVPYEVLAGDYRETNFSSGRMSWLGFHRSIERMRWRTIIPGFCRPAWDWWREMALLVGELPQALAGVGCRWTPPRREMVDPGKETLASKAAVRSGFTSLSEEIRQRGEDPEVIFAELAQDLEQAADLGLVLDTNPADDKGRNVDSPPSSSTDRTVRDLVEGLDDRTISELADALIERRQLALAGAGNNGDTAAGT